jgi:hypothetical protein
VSVQIAETVEAAFAKVASATSSSLSLRLAHHLPPQQAVQLQVPLLDAAPVHRRQRRHYALRRGRRAGLPALARQPRRGADPAAEHHDRVAPAAAVPPAARPAQHGRELRDGPCEWFQRILASRPRTDTTCHSRKRGPGRCSRSTSRAARPAMRPCSGTSTRSCASATTPTRRRSPAGPPSTPTSRRSRRRAAASS